MHRTELQLIQLPHEEIVRNIHDAQLTKLELQEIWNKKGVEFEPEDIAIKIHTAMLVVVCIDCGCVFSSEAEADDDPCPNFVEPVDEHTGIEAHFSIEPQQFGEWVDMYVYPSTGPVPNWNDLEVRRVYVKSDYYGHDPAEPKVAEPKSVKYPGRNPKCRKS